MIDLALVPFGAALGASFFVVTDVMGTRFEVKIALPGFKEGAFDVQQTAAVQATKFVRRLGGLDSQQLRLVERSLAEVLGLKLAENAPSQAPS